MEIQNSVKLLCKIFASVGLWGLIIELSYCDKYLPPYDYGD